MKAKFEKLLEAVQDLAAEMGINTVDRSWQQIMENITEDYQVLKSSYDSLLYGDDDDVLYEEWPDGYVEQGFIDYE